ncbi:MAG: ABC transporter permease [Clostridia bacterium]|nr:ABC transporter permease [Clostridia bacterium]
MPDGNNGKTSRRMIVRYRGRGAQVLIYLGKLLRMFIYQNDWKVLPMAALIAGLVGMVIRKRMFINMEGSLMGAFALVCVCIWNGCFNSVQVICRERDVIKREHRSGMHISSYICAHMLYQALLCLLQTGVTLYVTRQVGVQYPDQGVVTQHAIVDIGISMFLITFSSDMLSLWISTLAHTTTTAMTIMPFVLIFQLVFSGGMLTLPQWSEPLTKLTISNPGLKVLAAQSRYNELPLASIWNTLISMRNSEVGGEVTVGQIMDFLGEKNNPTVKQIRDIEIEQYLTVNGLRKNLEGSAGYQSLREKEITVNLTYWDLLRAFRQSSGSKEMLSSTVAGNLTLGDLLDNMMAKDEMKEALGEKVLANTRFGDLIDMVLTSGLLDRYNDTPVGGIKTVGDLIDRLAENPDIRNNRDQLIVLKTTLGKIIDMFGEQKVKAVVEKKAAEASYKPEYENTVDNVMGYWGRLFRFVILFVVLATITLERVDKDKR